MNLILEFIVSSIPITFYENYTEPENVKRAPDRAGWLINPAGGAIALQGHDPGSIFYFKDIRIKRLP